MYSRHDLVFKTIGGDVVWPSQQELDRINRENRKAAKELNAGADAWVYFAGKRIQKKYPKQVK